MQMIIVLGLIAKLASVSGHCDLGKTVHDFDFYKVSCDTFRVISGSLSPRHGASSGCGWRNGLRYGG